jgi:DNA-binding transcriptional regulator GbsR (MarR family)
MAAAAAPAGGFPALPRPDALAALAPGSAVRAPPARDARAVAARPAPPPSSAPGAPAAGTASPSERLAADAVGALVELWGFRRQLGRVWAHLFLSERPLTAPALRARLGISSGLLSMSLAELRGWGVVRRVAVPGDRKAHWEAETDVWRLVRHVLAERERRALERALATLQAALAESRGALADADPRLRSAARFQAQRIARLVGLGQTALGLLRALVGRARVDAGPPGALSDALAGHSGAGAGLPAQRRTRVRPSSRRSP